MEKIMKKLIITSLALTVPLCLVGCNTMNNTSQFANSTVGTGVKYGANTVGKGVGYISHTGAVVGQGVGNVVGTGVGFITGKPANYRHVNTYNNKVIYHNGHQYMIQNGRYVLVR